MHTDYTRDFVMNRDNSFLHVVNLAVLFLANQNIAFWQSLVAITCSLVATFGTLYFQWVKFRQSERRAIGANYGDDDAG